MLILSQNFWDFIQWTIGLIALDVQQDSTEQWECRGAKPYFFARKQKEGGRHEAHRQMLI